MATKRMLVDATHPEETRIIVTDGNRLEEFDFESASRKQLRGNIYLAKVTRVEPSLQAAFVEYGGNRHGFLAFSEIHPDYYQIPVADQEALEQKEEAEKQEALEQNEALLEVDSENSDDDIVEEKAEQGENDEGDVDSEATDSEESDSESSLSDEGIEQIGGIDPLDEDEPIEKKAPPKRYKIQEVIKRRQVMLVQVVKEERGNKGAALTTFLSLAGRYSVLMPNTPRGGGISRKITNAGDRKRLKEVASELEVAPGMGVILRTAGASRTKAEIKRDFEYLMRLWENVRTLTLKTSAPCLVYEEGSLIKRTIRDLYNKDITELLVAGANAHVEAKEFMKMIMPTHEKKVKLYKGDKPIFSKYNMETQLDSMFSPQVTLPSGGYIVINPTEALVSIDVNSGRATKERNIEATALQTNNEAAEEVARQLRLRDMAGLVVIDFIDMIEKKSIRTVERKLKDALRHDRARIQIGRISHFGLLEMSRQRMRFGVLESSTNVCPTCAGAGIVRSVESMALMVMRAIEDHVQRKPNNSIEVKLPADTALFLLNAKRVSLIDLEVKYNLSITISSDPTLLGSGYEIVKGEKRQEIVAPTHVSVNTTHMAEIDADDETPEQSEEEAKPKRRRRGGRNRNKNAAEQNQNDNEVQTDNVENKDASSVEANDNPETLEGEEEPKKRRRRGRRGGRRNNNRNQDDAQESNVEQTDADIKTSEDKKPEVAAEIKPSATKPSEDKPEKVEAEAGEQVKEKPKRKPRRSRKTADNADNKDKKAEEISEATSKEEKPKAKAEPKAKAKVKARKKTASDEIIVTSSKPSAEAEKKPKKGGWWQRNIFG